MRQDQTLNTTGLGDRFVNILSLADIGRLASRRAKHKVVAAVTGKVKTEAIKVALYGDLANVLITLAENEGLPVHAQTIRERFAE